ncbi:GDSL esterase/lipase [Hordeum vulgare]|nr:GDSL esterase/lipase [Hordeum vulgare]
MTFSTAAYTIEIKNPTCPMVSTNHRASHHAIMEDPRYPHILTGMTLAYDGAGVLDSTYHEVHTLTKQVDPLRKMVKDGTISKKQLSHLIVFVAISNNDYARTSMIGLSSSNDINAYTGKVTKDIAANVQQLFKLGVNKVLVNKLHPINCKLSQTRHNNYTSCDISWKLGCIHP